MADADAWLCGEVRVSAASSSDTEPARTHADEGGISCVLPATTPTASAGVTNTAVHVKEPRLVHRWAADVLEGTPGCFRGCRSLPTWLEVAVGTALTMRSQHVIFFLTSRLRCRWARL
jgi:hypothetical protein